MQKYKILDMIDEGAYGIVWKALNNQTRKMVAIKEFKETDDNEETRNTIQREIKMLKMLKGDYVVGIIEAFKKKGKISLIFQYFPKNLLNVIQKNNQGLEPTLINRIVFKIVKCLKFLHSKNIIHRDIKPENILLSQDNETLKLCDFGFARFIPENAKEMTDYVATRWYRSPQLLVGQPYGKPSDIFALGCIIGQLVDGQPMFPGQNQVDQIFLLKKYIGQLTANQHRYLFENHKFSGVQIPFAKNKQSLEERYLGKIQKNALSFMKACLKMNPCERITIQQALSHPYLIQLSTGQNQFQNDQQNLLMENRKVLTKNGRASIVSLQKDKFTMVEEQQSLILTKKKSYSKHDFKTKNNYGSVDYSSLPRQKQHNNSQLISQQMVKKKSHNNLLMEKSTPQSIHKKSNQEKILVKNMSESKHLKVNLDVNLNINLKIKKSDHKKNKQSFRDRKEKKPQKLQHSKLPQLKSHSKDFFLKNKPTLVGLSRKLNQGNLGIFGQSKQISNVFTKKLSQFAH